jgi:hypothetical protein
MSVVAISRAPGRVTRDARREEIAVSTGRTDVAESDVRTGAMMDTITQYAAPIAGAAAGLAIGLVAFPGKVVMGLGLGAAGAVGGYFLGKPAGQ